MGYGPFQRYEVYQANPLLLIHNITPVKTEPEILRAITELISVQVLTQQMLAKQVEGKAGGRSFISQGLRADESVAYDDKAEQIQTLTQRVEELERRLRELGS